MMFAIELANHHTTGYGSTGFECDLMILACYMYKYMVE